MQIPDEVTDLTLALEIIDDLIGVLQDLHHRFDVIEDFGAYGVAAKFLKEIEAALSRYDSLD